MEGFLRLESGPECGEHCYALYHSVGKTDAFSFYHFFAGMGFNVMELIEMN